jgi:hypothetical protein
MNATHVSKARLCESLGICQASGFKLRPLIRWQALYYNFCNRNLDKTPRFHVLWSFAVLIQSQIYAIKDDILMYLKGHLFTNRYTNDCLKNNTKIYIKIAPTCFDAISHTIFRERIIRAC